MIDMDRLNRVYNDVMGVRPAAASAAAPAAPAPVDPYAGKTFTDLVLDDMPSRIRSAESKATAGDIDGARKDLAYVREFRDKYADDLTDFTGFKGTHIIGRKVAAASAELLSMSHMERLEPLLNAPETRRKEIARKVQATGGGPLFERYAQEAGVDRDQRAISVMQTMLSMTGAEERETAARRSAVGRRAVDAGMEPEAAAMLVDPPAGAGARGERFLKYYEVAETALGAGGLPPGTIPASGAADILQPLFQAGDDASSGILAKNLGRFAGVSDTDAPEAARGKLAQMAPKLRDYSAALGDTARAALAPALNAIIDVSGSAAGVLNMDRPIRETLARIRPMIDANAESGAPLGDDAVAQLARVAFARSTATTDKLAAEDVKILDGMTKADQYAASVRVSAPVTMGAAPTEIAGPDGKPVPLPFGGDDLRFPELVHQKSVIARSSLLAAADMASGKASDWNTAVINRMAPALAEGFSRAPGTDRDAALAMGRIVAREIIATGGGVNLVTFKADMMEKYGAKANQLALLEAKQTMAVGTPAQQRDIYKKAAAQEALLGGPTDLGARDLDGRVYYGLKNAGLASGWDWQPGDKRWNSAVRDVRSAASTAVLTALTLPDAPGVSGAPGPAGPAGPTDIPAFASIMGSIPLSELKGKAAAGWSDKLAGKFLEKLKAGKSARTLAAVGEDKLAGFAKTLADEVMAGAADLPEVRESASDARTGDLLLSSKVPAKALLDRVLAHKRSVGKDHPLARPSSALEANVGRLDPARMGPVYAASAGDALNAISGAITLATLEKAVGGVNVRRTTFPQVDAVVTAPLAAGALAGGMAEASGAVAGLAAGAGVAAGLAVGAGVSLALGAGYLAYQAGLDDFQPADPTNLGGRLAKHAAVFLGTPQVATPQTATLATPANPAQFETPAQSDVNRALTGPGLTEQDRAALRKPLPNLPASMLESGADMVAALKGFDRYEEMAKRAVVDSAGAALYEETRKELKELGPGFSMDLEGALTGLFSLKGSMSDPTFRGKLTELRRMAEQKKIMQDTTNSQLKARLKLEYDKELAKYRQSLKPVEGSAFTSAANMPDAAEGGGSGTE